jgi:hypothetical protein
MGGSIKTGMSACVGCGSTGRLFTVTMACSAAYDLACKTCVQKLAEQHAKSDCCRSRVDPALGGLSVILSKIPVVAPTGKKTSEKAAVEISPCNCKGPGGKGRHRLTCPVSVSYKESNAVRPPFNIGMTWADFCAHILPATEITDNNENGQIQKMLHSEKHVSPSMLRVLSGRPRTSLDEAVKEVRRYLIKHIMEKVKPDPDALIQLVDNLTCTWVLGTLVCDKPELWDKPFMSTVVERLQEDRGTVGQAWHKSAA